MRTGIRWSLALVATLLLSPAAIAKPALGNCTIACDNKLASCEQKLGRDGHCPRKHTICVETCTTPPKKERRSKSQQRRVICEQHCDLNRTTCEQSNGNAPHCEAGRNNCLARCR